MVLLGLDGFPLSLLRQSTSPNLWRLASEGGCSPSGGRSGLPSTTYPGFASLLTGQRPSTSGIRTTAQREGAVPGWAGADRTAAPTLVRAAAGAGLEAAVVMGDQELQKVVRLDEHQRAWPPAGQIPAGTSLDAQGYPTNAALRPHLLAAAADPRVDLLFGHLNESDTVGHDTGPQSAESAACAAGTDALLRELFEALHPDWQRTLIAVTSDHDMDRRMPWPAIDPTTGLDCAGLVDDWIADGSAAWVRLSRGAEPHHAITALSSREGVEGWRWREPNRLLLLASPGRVFAAPHVPVAGVHGSTATARTLAIVGGGHPAIPELARVSEERAPRLQDWAPTIAGVLGFDLPAADGLSLLHGSELEAEG